MVAPPAVLHRFIGSPAPALPAPPRRREFGILPGPHADAREGDKVDFWLLTDEAFDRARFDRRYVERLAGSTKPTWTRWAGTLGVAGALRRLRAEAQPIE